jgi:D-beta-D-heptose 7-phosphate kinase/D-beta-D-heptose 1-phosphate adenosyltransferase
MTIFTNGCFDIIHYGHVKLLEYCKNYNAISFGGKVVWPHVVVGVNSDSSVKRLKGNQRPINPEAARVAVLKSLRFVDEVIIFEEDTPYELIKKVKPDIIVKGGDYKKEDVAGNDLAKVLIFDYINGHSTSNIIEKSKHDPKQVKT